MRLRELLIHVETAGGRFGTRIKFSDGLVIVRADNNLGKSTCFKTILVALGMEAMLTTKRSELPLTPAVLREIDTPSGKQTVTESSVYLEIENDSGDRMTTHRQLVGPRGQDLVGVWRGPMLSEGGEHPYEDFFVNREGSATRDAGFHRTLSRFIGWELPTVPTYEGIERPLYMQVLFPFFFVEQKRGWASDVPALPTQFGIRDPHKRSVEFLLDLDAYRNAVRRQELEIEVGKRQAEWAEIVKRAKELADQLNGQIQGLPISATVSWPPESPPTFFVPIQNEWKSITARLEIAREGLQQLCEQEIPRVEEVAVVAESELAQAESELAQQEFLFSEMAEASRFERAEIVAMNDRLAQIQIDLTRNKDDRTLRRLGTDKLQTLSNGECPTCHQSMQDSLLPVADGQTVMTLDQNIAFLEEQRKMLRGAMNEAEESFETREQQLLAARQEMSEKRNRVRALKQTLVSDGRLPSAAAIEQRLRLEQEIERLEKASDAFQEILSSLNSLSATFRKSKFELDSLPARNVSKQDTEKIGRWTLLLREQLNQYGFGSFDQSEVQISEDTYRPIHDGFDLVSSISASDLIRTIWGYLLGMLELSRGYEMNHLGIVVFDEPRQQSAKKVSFAELLRRAASSAEQGQQVVFFTSEEVANLTDALDGFNYSLIDYGDDENILRKM